MDFKTEISKAIKANREKLGDSSLNTYSSILSSLCKQMKGEQNIKWFSDDITKILEHLSSSADNKRKTVLSALYVLTKLPQYHDLMIVDCKRVNEAYKQQKMSVTQKDNWLPYADIVKTYRSLYGIALPMLQNKSPIDMKPIQQCMLLALCGGIYESLPPRRATDYAMMKYKNFNKDTENYWDAKKSSFVFNIYKTVKFYGRQEIKITDKELVDLIKKYIKLPNPTDYFFYGKTGEPWKQPQVTQHLNVIFAPDKVSVDLLRHAFITNFYSKGMPSLDAINTLCYKMAHNLSTQLQYIKTE